MSFKMDLTPLEKGLDLFNNKKRDAMKMYAKTIAERFETHAKRKRPWTDRTGDARDGLEGWEEELTFKFRVWLMHSVDYGVYLELAYGKNYAIIEPTLLELGPDAIRGMVNLIEKFK